MLYTDEHTCIPDTNKLSHLTVQQTPYLNLNLTKRYFLHNQNPQMTHFQIKQQAGCNELSKKSQLNLLANYTAIEHTQTCLPAHTHTHIHSA